MKNLSNENLNTPPYYVYIWHSEIFKCNTLTGSQAIEFFMGSLSIGSTQQCGSLYDAIREQTLQSILGGVQIG